MIELFTCLKLFLLNILCAQSCQSQHALSLSGDMLFVLYVAHLRVTVVFVHRTACWPTRPAQRRNARLHLSEQ